MCGAVAAGLGRGVKLCVAPRRRLHRFAYSYTYAEPSGISGPGGAPVPISKLLREAKTEQRLLVVGIHIRRLLIFLLQTAKQVWKATRIAILLETSTREIFQRFIFSMRSTE